MCYFFDTTKLYQPLRFFSQMLPTGKKMRPTPDIPRRGPDLLHIIQPGQLKEVTQIVNTQLLEDPPLDG